MIFFENLLPVLMNTHKCFSFHFCFQVISEPLEIHINSSHALVLFLSCIFLLLCSYLQEKASVQAFQIKAILHQTHSLPRETHHHENCPKVEEKGKARFTQDHHLILDSLIPLGLSATQFYFYLSSSLQFALCYPQQRLQVRSIYCSS